MSHSDNIISSTPDLEASIRLPSSLFENITDFDNIGVFFTFYGMSTLFPVGEREPFKNDIPSRVKVATQVIGSTVGGDNFTFENLSEAIEVSFKLSDVRVTS